MALPDQPSAADLAEFLRRNDPRHPDLLIHGWTFDAEWTARDRREVTAAARRNTSVRNVSLDVDGLTAKSAKVVASVVRHLGHNVRRLAFCDSREAFAPAPAAAVDSVLAAVLRSGATLASLEIGACISPASVLKVVERHPDLDELVFRDYLDDADYDPAALTALAVAVASAVGRLSSLRKVALFFCSSRFRALGILAALHTAPTVRTVEIGFPPDEEMDDVIVQAAFFCVCTKTIQAVIFRGEDGEDGEDGSLADMSPLFSAVPGPSFSTSINEVQFQDCSFEETEGTLAKRAANAFANVDSLRFVRCFCPDGLKIVERMPQLRRFSFVSQAFEDTVPRLEAHDNDDDEYSFLTTNAGLAAFCRVINQKASVLRDVEIELHGSMTERFPATARLLRSSRGRLLLNLVGLPRAACAHLVGGAERLHEDLRELRLRFRACHFTDQDSADILRAMRSNRTLGAFEFDLGGGGPSPLALAAIHDLVEGNETLKTLSFRVLDSGSGAKVLESIVPALRSSNRSLRMLGLHGADLNLAGDWPRLVGPVLEMLEENCVLSMIDGVALPADDPVAFVLRQNRYGRRLLRTNDSSPIGIWAAVLANVSRDGEHGVMYKFLRSKADLWVRTTLPPAARRGPRRRSSSRGRKRGRGAR